MATSATGFTLGGASGGTSVGFGLGQPAVAPTTSSTGFGFGATPIGKIQDRYAQTVDRL